MYEVELIFEGKTNVWMTEDVVDAILEHDGADVEVEIEDASGAMSKKIEYWSKAGFLAHEGGAKSGRPIKDEGGGVFRLGLFGDLFRIYGFYEEDDFRRKSFIAILAHGEKRGTKLSKIERKLIKKVQEVKANGDWKKKTDAAAENEGSGSTIPE